MFAAVHSARGHLQESAALLDQSRDIFRKEGEDWWYALSLINDALNHISLGKLQESEALFPEAFRLVEPGDLRLGLPLRDRFAYVLNLKGDFARAEQLLQEALQLSYQLGNDRVTSTVLLDLGRVALATHRIELAEEYLQESIDVQSKYGGFSDLPMHRIYLGKCFAARPDRPAARDQFRQAIKIGQTHDKFFLVYWGLANIARTYLEEGQTAKALEIAQALNHCPVESKSIQDEVVALLADLQPALPGGEIGAAAKQVEGEMSPDQAKADVLALALGCEHE
jgi:tetratricopeptide (TPR) repeat protein